MTQSEPATVPPRKIVHIDMDAFFAAVEQRDHPELRGKPVAVGGGSQRGVVAAASYEARTYGVRSALPSVIARRKCPDLIFVKPRFEVYKAVSQQIQSIFHEYTDLVEPLSLDEAYLDVTENKPGIALASELARKVRAKIFEVTGLTASAGVSYNKFLAKTASGFQKPNGQYVIPPERGEAFVAKLPVGKFYGIGPATEKKMHELDIQTGADLRDKTLEFLQSHFGKSGAFFHSISRGIDDRPVRSNRERKSVGAENTFTADIYTIEQAYEAVTPLIEKVMRHCDSKNLRGRTITLKAKYNDFHQITRSKSTIMPVSEKTSLQKTVNDLLTCVFPTDKGIRLLGVTMSSFDSVEQSLEEDQLALMI